MEYASYHGVRMTAWNDDLLHNPHAVADKRRRVQAMFSAIAPSYDLNNRLHSLWMDQRWRKRAVREANVRAGDIVVDVACGTGDLSLAFAANENHPKVIGIDFTFPMLPIARSKSDRATQYVNGDAQSLPLPDVCCDVVSIAFGIRNVQQPQIALNEFFRVLRPGGRIIILEFGLPKNPLLKFFYNTYFRHVLPRSATWISGDKTGAYKYLPESVNTFISREKLTEMLIAAGFEKVESQSLTFGVCICYRGVKR